MEEPSLISQAAIIPLPSDLRFSGSELRLKSPIPLFFPQNIEQIREIADICCKIQRSIGGPALLPTNCDTIDKRYLGIFLTINENGLHKDDAYLLRIDEDDLRISASSPKGLFYGMQSLMQLLSTTSLGNDEIKLPTLEISDSPRFDWRGMHLDVSRHFFPVEFIKKCINLLAFHKMNIFHWHLTDDQGWRIEIKKYARLTEIGAWRTESDGKRYGGFYSQAEIRDIVHYARARHVTIVPEIELPGHASAALAAYPKLSCTGGPFEVETKWGIFDDVYCVGQDSTFAFLENVLSEVAELFPGPYIHIGGDECPKARWQSHELCQRRKKDVGLANENNLQSYFISRIGRHLDSLGKRLVGWDEILDGGAPETATIMAWRSAEKGIEAALAGHNVVMTPMPFCYFDHYQSQTNERKAIGGFTPLEKVYEFEPVPQELPSALSRHIIGAQGNVWTEYMPNESHVEYMMFPRICALSEVLWSPPETRSLPAFRERLRPHLQRLETWGVNYRRLTD